MDRITDNNFEQHQSRKEKEEKNRISFKITGDDLYKYCTDFGLMLSWGIPIMKVLDEMGKSTENLFLKKLSSLVGENILRGETISSTYDKFPEVFKPVFTKWVRIGERFGMLDEAFLKMAGIIRFEDLLVGSASHVPGRETGGFLLKVSQIISEKDNYRPDRDDYRISPHIFKTLKEIAGEGMLKDWIAGAECSETHNLFSISMVEYLTGSIHKRIANASFWHILGTAEEGGYLPEMMEIMGLYLTDKNNLLPDSGMVEVDLLLTERKISLEGIVEKLLEKIREMGTGTIKIENRNFIYISEEKETSLSEITGSAAGDNNELIAIVNRLKLMLDLDPAERRLAQTVTKEMTFGGEKFIVRAKTTPPFSFPPQRENAGYQTEEENPEYIEINIERVENEK